tara:strand:+ start:966 stop:1340 length:375 start_codon:yes stop_codon:yes gene_type:complete
MANCNTSQVQLDVARRLDIICRKGDTFNLVINVTDSAGTAVDLTTYSDFRMEVRETDTSASTIIADSNVTITGTSGGVLTVTINNTIMEGVDGGLYAYDLETIKSGVVQTWLTGVLQVNEDVTV